MKPALNLLVLYTADLAATRDFYTTLGLEFQAERHGRGPEHWSARSGALTLELYPSSEQTPVSSGLRLGFAVTELEPLLERLLAGGGKLVSAPLASQWGTRAVVSDHEGRKIELVEASSRDGRCC